MRRLIVLFLFLLSAIVGDAWGAVEYTMTDIGPVAALAINDYGQVVGLSGVNDHAFLYSNGVMQDLGTLPGGGISFAYGISNNGQVVGVSTTSLNAAHAFLYSNGIMQDLGTLGGASSFAYGVNNSGQVVGYSQITSDNNPHAFLYSNGSIQDLNTLIAPNSGWMLEYAQGINDSGQIIAEGINASGQVGNAFLLTPVPEPSTIIVWSCLGAIGLMGFAWRRYTGRQATCNG